MFLKWAINNSLCVFIFVVPELGYIITLYNYLTVDHGRVSCLLLFGSSGQAMLT